MTREPMSIHRDGAPDFDVKWPEPDDAMQTWSWDSAHEPYPLTPLSIDFSRITGHYCAIARGEEPRRTIYVHGYAYGLSSPADDVPAQASEDEKERQRRVAEAAPRMLDVWEREYLPRIRTVCREMWQRDYSSMSIEALSSALDGYMDGAARAFALTEEAAGPMLEGRYRFVDFCTDRFGPEGEARAAAMEQGFANESTASDVGLWSLARLARGSSTVDRVLRRYRADELLAVLPTVPGGATFLQELDRYLDRFGWRTEMWGELSMPTWREDPRHLLRIVQSYVSGEVEDPRKALARSANRRRRMVKRVRATLEGRPGLLAVFDSMLPMVRQVVPVKEGRALWQLAVGGSLRIPCLALDRKLRDEGVIECVEDVFYLRLREIKEIVAGRGHADMRDLVRERRADRARWMPVLPPATIGGPASLGADRPSISSTAARAPEPERVLRGMAASSGVVRGPAKVVLALTEAATLAPGDIMVSRTTSPAWTPMFARVSAVVVDSGSVLGHTGIVAREYGIPCVVGVKTATAQIRDGMMITVDGNQGIVRIGGPPL